MSKYPILETDGMIYKAGNQIDSWAAKQVHKLLHSISCINRILQVIYAKVQVSPTFFVHVFTTHMQGTGFHLTIDFELTNFLASYYDNHASINVINDKARATQVSEMADFIKSKTEGSPYPALITGDFNIDSRGEPAEYKYMMETLLAAKPTVKDLLAESYLEILCIFV